MSPENDAIRRCERLLALMAEAVEMERVVGERTAGADATTHGLLAPILHEALVRLEPMLRAESRRPIGQWISELTDLELQLDALMSRRGWRAWGPAAEPPLGGEPS